MNGRGYIFILALFLLLTACQGVEVPSVAQPGDGYARAQLDVTLQVDNTKSVVEGTTLAKDDRTYGIIACEHEDVPTEFPIYDRDNANLYGNIQAWYGNYYNGSKYLGKKWWYSYEASSSLRFSPLYFVTDNTSRHMDIYAYAPWESGVVINNAIKYDLVSVSEKNLPDLLYATYDDADGNPTNINISIVDQSTIPVSIQFHHAFALIAIHFKLATVQDIGFDGIDTIRLSQIDLVKASSSVTPLYSEGKMDILTGNLTNSGFSRDKQSVTYSTDLSSSEDWSTSYMLVYPTEYLQSGDFSFKIMFNGNDIHQTIIQDYSIQRSDLLHIDGTYGFQKGYCYHFYFIIDNYIHLQDVVINTAWELTDETELTAK